jgi:hypothetical protein
MSDPQYGARLQRLADFLVAAIPEGWVNATVRVSFPSRARTDLEVRFRASEGQDYKAIGVDGSILRDFARAARDVREELTRAGNPECLGFLFSLSKSGTSALDVSY